MDFPLEDDHWIETPTYRVDILDDSSPLSISRLDNNRPIPSVRSSDYLRRTCDTHLETGFVKVVDIVVENTVVANSLSHPRKPR